MKETRPKVYIHLAHGSDVENYYQNYLKGIEPDKSPYGFHLAEEEGFEVVFPKDMAGGLDRFIRRILMKFLGLDLLHAFRNRNRIRSADIVWVMTEPEAFSIAALFALSLVGKKPMIANAVWLFNIWDRLPGYRKWLFRRLANQIETLTVHSKGCLPVAAKVFPSKRVTLMYFGVNTDVFKMTAPTTDRGGGPLRIFAAGNDRTRDWKTFLEAFGNDPRFAVTLICSWVTDEEFAKYNNVSTIRRPSMADFLSCYRQADIVAVPMKENIFSGITVALEAAALGRTILSTRTGGISTYFEEADVLYAPVGDAAAMRQVVLESTPETRHICAENAQRRFVERGYSTRDVMRRYAELSKALI